jgi:hypothetical protein
MNADQPAFIGGYIQFEMWTPPSGGVFVFGPAGYGEWLS